MKQNINALKNPLLLKNPHTHTHTLPKFILLCKTNFLQHSRKTLKVILTALLLLT